MTHEVVDLRTPASRRTLAIMPELAAELTEACGDHCDDEPLLFDAGRTIVQVSRWSGHTDASSTLHTYVHLIDAGIGEALAIELPPALKLVS